RPGPPGTDLETGSTRHGSRDRVHPARISTTACRHPGQTWAAGARTARMRRARLLLLPNTVQLCPRMHLRSIQYLRAVAALMVAYFHTVDQIPAYRPLFERYLLGNLNLASGVDIFFVISGFIMLVSNRNSRPVSFAVRRVIRIVPLYWFLT